MPASDSAGKLGAGPSPGTPCRSAYPGLGTSAAQVRIRQHVVVFLCVLFLFSLC